MWKKIVEIGSDVIIILIYIYIIHMTLTESRNVWWNTPAKGHLWRLLLLMIIFITCNRMLLNLSPKFKRLEDYSRPWIILISAGSLFGLIITLIFGI